MNNPKPTVTREVSTDALLDDNESIHSRHALKVFKNGSARSEPNSPFGSSISVNTTAAPQHSTNMSEEEAAAWRGYRNKTLIRAAVQLLILFIACATLLFVTLYFALPKIDDADRDDVKIPRSFEQLKALNAVLQRYKDEYFFRVMLCWVVIYMFLQAFSIPGSMYMSIIAGAMWGVPLALPIVCASVATGATICYLISKNLGVVLIAMPKWKARVDAWGDVLAGYNDNMLSYLIVLRMMPLPPHNIVNILAPHLGIKIPLFWISTFFGIFAVSMIHVTIGEKLDQMTSADDFNLFSVRNTLLLGGVCCAVLVPVFVRKYSAAAHTPLEEDVGRGGGVRLGEEEESFLSDEDEDELPRVSLRGAMRGSGGGPDGEDEEGRAAYVARAWRGVEIDADVHSDGEGAGDLGDQEEGATFEDRREQSGAPTKSRKARRVLGIAGQSDRAPPNDSYMGKMGNWIQSSLNRS
ncbi:hypothetical protein CBS101457_006817 [Exobasidium rhododendri]|nr:hypothetical protein CBS101457_006817 [Exobasidium rhododendri]